MRITNVVLDVRLPAGPELQMKAVSSDEGSAIAGRNGFAVIFAVLSSEAPRLDTGSVGTIETEAKVRPRYT